MTTIKVDENGIPVYSAEDIELKTEEVITHFNKEILNTPQQTPLLEFIEELHRDYNLQRDYSQILGSTKYGNEIQGKTQLDPLGLFVDVSLQGDSRFSFVLGHEFGHVVLHKKVDVKAAGYEDQELIDTEINYATGKKNLITPRDWLEWQANYFSSSILMPRSSVITAVVIKQKELGIKRNIGRIILEQKGYSRKDYNEVRSYLEGIYSVNATNVECRLKELGILIDRRNINVQHVSELFTTE